MADQASTPNDRAETARRHDDRDIIENMEGAPGGSDMSGGRVAQDVGSRDELNRLVDPDGSTSVRGSDKVQPNIPTRADNEGANG